MAAYTLSGILKVCLSSQIDLNDVVGGLFKAEIFTGAAKLKMLACTPTYQEPDHVWSVQMMSLQISLGSWGFRILGLLQTSCMEPFYDFVSVVSYVLKSPNTSIVW